MHPTKLFNASFGVCLSASLRLYLQAFSVSFCFREHTTVRGYRSITHASCHPCDYYLLKSAQETKIYIRRQQSVGADSTLTVSRPALNYLAQSTCKHAPADMLPTRHVASSHADNVYTHKQQAPLVHMRLAYLLTGAYFLSNSLHSTESIICIILSMLKFLVG